MSSEAGSAASDSRHVDTKQHLHASHAPQRNTDLTLSCSDWDTADQEAKNGHKKPDVSNAVKSPEAPPDNRYHVHVLLPVLMRTPTGQLGLRTWAVGCVRRPCFYVPYLDPAHGHSGTTDRTTHLLRHTQPTKLKATWYPKAIHLRTRGSRLSNPVSSRVRTSSARVRQPPRQSSSTLPQFECDQRKSDPSCINRVSRTDTWALYTHWG